MAKKEETPAKKNKRTTGVVVGFMPSKFGNRVELKVGDDEILTYLPQGVIVEPGMEIKFSTHEEDTTHTLMNGKEQHFTKPGIHDVMITKSASTASAINVRRELNALADLG